MALSLSVGIFIDHDLYDHGAIESLEMITEIGTADPEIEIIAEVGSEPPGDPQATMITETYLFP